ncbi:hypothetical protein ACW5W8_23285, partial [Aeromonas aquatilis]
SSLIFKGFSRLSTRLFALPLALSMEAHYRDLDHACKSVLELNSYFWLNRSLINQKAHLSCNNTLIWRYRYLNMAWRREQIKVVAIWSLYIYMHGDRGHAFG